MISNNGEEEKVPSIKNLSILIPPDMFLSAPRKLLKILSINSTFINMLKDLDSVVDLAFDHDQHTLYSCYNHPSYEHFLTIFFCNLNIALQKTKKNYNFLKCSGTIQLLMRWSQKSTDNFSKLIGF